MRIAGMVTSNGQRPKTLQEIKDIVNRISYRDRRFVVIDSGPSIYLQIHYDDIDVDTGKMEEQHTRKWLISPFMTKSEIVQTAFKAVMTSQEHIAREWFNYKEARVYGPHFDVDDLVDLCKTGKLDARTPKL